MTIGASCSDPSTASRKSRKPIFGASPIRRSSRGIARSASSSLPHLRPELPLLRKEVDNETLADSRADDASCGELLHGHDTNLGTDELEADTDSEVAAIQACRAEADRATEWHGDLSAGRPRVAADRWNCTDSRRRAQRSCRQGWTHRHLR